MGISDASGRFLKDGNTDAAGAYRIEVPAADRYWLGASAWVKRGDYHVHQFRPVSRGLTRKEEKTIRADVVMVPVGNIVLHLHDANGQLIRNGAAGSATGGQGYFSDGRSYATDAADLPNGSIAWAVHDSQSYGRGWEEAVPAFIVPIGQPVALHVLWQVSGFGLVLVHADNAGAGYRVAEQGDYIVVNFLPEAARTSISRLRRDYTAYSGQGYPLSASVAGGFQSAEVHFTTAERLASHLFSAAAAIPE